jgi:hypothetical protein
LAANHAFTSLRVRLRAVAFEGQQVVAAAAHDPLGDRRLAGERVQAHQAAREVQPVQQVGQDRQLPALGLGRALGQHDPALGRVGADQVQGRASLAEVERAPDGLAVDRHLPRPVPPGPEHRPHPAQERALERVRVDQHQHPPEGVVRGDAVRQLEEALQPPPLAAAVQRDVLEALGLAQGRAHRDHQDVEQPVLDLPFAAGILDRLERADQGFQHGLPPSGKAEPLAAHPVGIELLISCVTPGPTPR